VLNARPRSLPTVSSISLVALKAASSSRSSNAPAALDNGDLAVTTDYRDVIAEILEKRLGNTDLDEVFPGYSPSFLGIIV
jgi:hypothetical protein